MWDHLILAEWGAPLEITVNPYAGFSTGVIGVRCMAMVDTAVTHAGAFSVATSIT